MKCPGQDSRYWKPGAIFEATCPKCGNEVEFFKDDTTRICKKCGHRFLNPELDFGCASYCKYAEQCIGNLPPELIAQKEDLLKDRVAIEMKRCFKQDFRRIGHATRVARYAEQIGKAEQGNLAVILTAAYLLDIDIDRTQRNHSQVSAATQMEGGPVGARDILTKLGAGKALIEEVCEIIAHHHHRTGEESLNSRILSDADLIATIEEKKKQNKGNGEIRADMLENSFLTESGRTLSKKLFSQ